MRIGNFVLAVCPTYVASVPGPHFIRLHEGKVEGLGIKSHVIILHHYAWVGTDLKDGCVSPRFTGDLFQQ